MRLPVNRVRAGYRGDAGGEKGFTLIELVVSSAVMSLILGAAYICFSSGVASQKMVDGRLDMGQRARVALAIISADLRSAAPLSKEFEFLGMDRMLGEVEADNLDFGSTHYGPRRLGEGDFCEVSYYLLAEPETGAYALWRRRQPGISFDPLAGGEREEIARGLRGLRFEYYDGLDWYDEWGDAERRGVAETTLQARANLEGLPEAVRVTMWFDPELSAGERLTGSGGQREAAVKFQTVVRLNLAAWTWEQRSGFGMETNQVDSGGVNVGLDGTGGMTP